MRLITRNDDGYQLEEYLNYLKQIEGDLPEDTRSFALAPWHYDMEHHWCPHDSWLETITLQELARGDRREIRKLGIVATFFGAYHDGFFDITYKDVTSYSLNLEARRDSNATVVHGDWIIDEILLTEDGLVSHEIEFSESGVWKISCHDIVYQWRALAPRVYQ